MYKWLSFDDVLLDVQFTFSKSRKDVSTSQEFCGMNLDLPLISSNMDTVTSPELAHAMSAQGAVSSLHRFQSIEDNVKQFLASPKQTIGSFGLGAKELDRAVALSEAGCTTLLLDIAHGASIEAVSQVRKLREVLSKYDNIIVGNFANCKTIQDYIYYLGNPNYIQAVKVGIGGGAACLTRKQTGHGRPTFSSVVDCVRAGIPVIADGGHRGNDDIIKSLAAGAKVVMLGKLLAGTTESPGELIGSHKKYRGSASQESYEAQGKVASHRVYEGDSYLVPHVGTVADVLQGISGGIRSALTYSGATNLTELRERAEFGEVSSSGASESGSHGKNTK